jgi:hypothetical protein
LDEEGLPYYRTDGSELTFKIGRNPLQSDDRPWDYVLVRHIPVAQDTFAFYGDDLLPAFDNAPTWKYATPHGIQRVTAQNQSCDNCHGKAELYLTADDVAAEELESNATVIVESPPIWSEAEFPPVKKSTTSPSPPSGLYWMLGAGLVIATIATVPFVRRRNRQ